MQSLIDPAGLVHAGIILRAGIIVTGLQFLHGNFVRGVAINLVGAHEDEDRVAAMLASGFEQIESAERIDLKIENGNVAGFVVGRLSGAVNDQLEAIGFEKLFERVAIANIEAGVMKILRRTFEAIQIPSGIARCAEKHLAHVVVHSNDAMALSIKILHCLGADKSATSCDKYCFHILRTGSDSVLNFSTPRTRRA